MIAIREVIKQTLLVPVHAVVMLVILPVMFVGWLSSSVSFLATGIPSVILHGDVRTVFEFIRSKPNTTDTRWRSILMDKFPNSIAVRS